MPRKSQIHASTVPEPARIVIERRVIVAEISEDERGEHPILRAAFMAASDALADSLHSEYSVDRLQFTWGAHMFEITAEPTARESEVSTPVDSSEYRDE